MRSIINRPFSDPLMTLRMVRVTGLEPVRHRHTPLKRACLPVPAHSQKTLLDYYSIEIEFVNRKSKKEE